MKLRETRLSCDSSTRVVDDRAATAPPTARLCSAGDP